MNRTNAITPRAGPAISAGGAPEPADLIREARRRQRRRWLLISLTVTVVVAGAGGIAAALRSPGQPRAVHRSRPARTAPAQTPRPLADPIPGSVGTSLLLWPVGYPAFGPDFGPPTYLDDLASGRLSLVRNRPALAAGDYQPLLRQAGRWLVFVGGGGTMAIADNLRGAQRVLSRTPFFAASATPGQVWLERFSGGYLGQGTASVWQVSVPGGRPGPVLALPPRTLLVAGTGAGLLLEVPQGSGDFGLALWNPGGALRVLPYAPFHGDGFDVSARYVAYGTGCQVLDTTGQDAYDLCRVLRIYDVITGQLFSAQPPPGTAGWLPGGFNDVQALAPGGARIAAYAATRPLGHGTGRLYVLRLSGRSLQPSPVPSSVAQGGPRTAWSADGSWLFYQGPGQRLWAYQVSRRSVGQSRTPCCGYTVMAAFPSRR